MRKYLVGLVLALFVSTQVRADNLFGGGGGGGGTITGLTAGTVPVAGSSTSIVDSSTITNSGGATIINSGSNAVSSLVVQDNGVAALSVIDNSSTVVNGLRVQGGATGAGPLISTAANNASIGLVPHGTGAVSIGGVTSSFFGFKGRNGGSQAELVLGDGTGRSLMWLTSSYYSGTGGNYSPTAFVTDDGGGGRVSVASQGKIGFASTAAADATLDAFFTKESAAVVQLGSDASTSTAYTIKGNDATGSTNAGGALTVAGGNATSGIANGGPLNLNGGAKNSSGTNGAVNIGASNTSAVNITPATSITGAFSYGGTLNSSDIVTVTASATISHRWTACGSAASGSVALTLPASPTVGDIYTIIQRNASQTCVMTANSGQTLDGAATATLSAGVALGKDETCYYLASNDWHCSGAGT